MKRTCFIAVGILALSLSGGCTEEKPGPGPDPENRPSVVMSGRLEQQDAASRARIIPDAQGLPPTQLTVGIATVGYTSADPAVDQPGTAAWSGTTVSLSRGYFGGPGLNPPTVSTGEIQFTDEDGTRIQRMLYDEGGEYYFAHVYHPFVNASGDPVSKIQPTAEGASLVISGLDGSQDVMFSNLAWGNVDHVEMTTAAVPNSEVILSHMFSLFRVKVKAESEKAATQFGQIEDFILRFQPAGVGIDMISLDVTPSSSDRTDYPMVGFAQFALFSMEGGVRVAKPGVFDVRNPDGSMLRDAETPLDAGYVMALPATGFRFEALTEDRLWVQANVSFATTEDAFAKSAPGTAYDVVITLMESYEVQWEVQPVKYWWLDSVFD